MADNPAITLLEQQAAEIRERIAPAEAAIKDDRAELAKIIQALDVLQGKAPSMTVESRHSASRRSTRERYEMDEDMILAVVGNNSGPVAAAEIRADLNIPSDRSNALSVKLKNMVEGGQLAKQGERRATRYSLPKAGS